MENVIVEIDKKVAISFSKTYKGRTYEDENGNIVEINIKDLKQDITDFIAGNKEVFDSNFLTSFVYDFDLDIGITVMKPKKEFDVYVVVSIFSLAVPEETIEDDEEKSETAQISKSLKESEE